MGQNIHTNNANYSQYCIACLLGYSQYITIVRSTDSIPQRVLGALIILCGGKFAASCPWLRSSDSATAVPCLCARNVYKVWRECLGKVYLHCASHGCRWNSFSLSRYVQSS